MTLIDRLTPVFLAETFQRTVEEWGERCPDVEPECPCCKAWAFYDRYGVCPTLENLKENLQ